MTSIYISSTYADLVPYRDAVVRALRKMNKRVVAMEDYIATDSRPLAKCTADIEVCDVYVGIFAWRYGYVPQAQNSDGRSVTELEYRHAVRMRKECLIFLLNPKGTPWATDWMDAVTGDNEHGRRISELRDELVREKTVSFFSSPEQLASLVGIAVSNWEEAQREPADVPAQPGTGPGTRLRGAEERLRDLDDNISQALHAIKQAEEVLRYEDDPERRTEIRGRIGQLRSAWTEYSRECQELEAMAMGGRETAGTQRAAAGLRELDRKLERIPQRERRPGIGLALSGGGFRAALYHLGSLWRLNELGVLPRLSEVATVSAGSMVGGLLGLHWRELRFDSTGVASNFVEVVAQPVMALCTLSIDRPSILKGWLLPGRNPGDILVDKLRDEVFEDATLQDLPHEPRFTFYATSMQTGASVRLCRDYLAERHIGVVWKPDVALARAIGASCAVPPFFCPVVLDVDPQAWEKTDDADLHRDWQLRSHLSLADGGLYDSLALERVWDRYDTVLVSDALQEFNIESRGFGRFFDRASRTLNILATQSHGLRKRKLIEDFRAGNMAGAYWGIGMQLADFHLEAQGLPAAMIPDNDTTRSLKKLRTRFAPFNRQEQGRLINWGFALTDAAIRRHLLPDAPAPEGWPMPDFGV